MKASRKRATFTSNLFKALAKRDVASAELMIEQGADVNALNTAGERPLTVAVRAGSFAKIGQLLIRAGANPNLMNRTRKTPLMIAAAHGRVRWITMLARAGADVNRVNRQEESALSYAVVWHRLQAAATLLELGADVNAPAPQWSPLMYAAFEGQLAMVRLLLEHGAKKQRRDKMGRRAIDLARGRSRKRLVELLR